MTQDRASVVATAALHIVARYVPEIFADSIVPLHAELAMPARRIRRHRAPSARRDRARRLGRARSEPALAGNEKLKGTANEESRCVPLEVSEKR